MKRLISAVLLLTMIFCCTACGGNQEFSNNMEGTGNSPSSALSSGEKGEQNTENTTDSVVPSKEYDNVYPQHEPYGTGIGAMPGRVVWAHDPDSVDWDGNGYWWETDHFDEARILSMVNDSIASLGGKNNAKEGWAALFSAHNASHGKSGGYAAGQKIAIKANINGSAVYDDDTSGETKMSYTNPVLLKALLISLVEEASVFVSQDPVAIDSVGADFLMNEPTVTENNGALRGDPTVENYLHEAGLVGNAPSGTIYTDSQGHTVTNLGVHEHWCNSTEKLYSRNLGKSEGIELIQIAK